MTTKYAQSTLVKDIFKGIPLEVSIRFLVDNRASFRDDWAKVLMACEREQTECLQHLWDKWQPDRETTVTWFLIVKNGKFLDFLNPDSKEALGWFRLCHACVDQGKYFGAQDERTAGNVSGRKSTLHRRSL